MHDSVSLEEKSVPAAMIVTSEFLHEAYMQRAALGMDEIEPVIIKHPLSTLSDEQIEGRAREAASQAKKVWLGE